MTALAVEIQRAVRAAMEWAGYRRYGRAELYMRPLANGVSAWASTGRSSTRGEVYEIAPKVGVRHERVHAIVAHLTGTALGTEPTVSTYLGYLTEHRSSAVVWPFGDPSLIEEQARDLVDAIVRYGLAYTRLLSSLERALIEVQRDSQYGPKRLPVALALLGRPEEARAAVETQLEALGERDDPWAQDYRAFVPRLLEALPGLAAETERDGGV